jgi:glycosyltransferase involved in cell wall biosynthesis
MPFLTVIVPFFGDVESAGMCLASIRKSTYGDYELFLADDCSPDAEAISAVAERHGAAIVRLQSNSGPAAARNAAAVDARGEILVFFDADETVHPDTLARIAAAFESDATLDALIGSYDVTPGVRGTVAVFRNLLHAYVHHRSAGIVSTFWAGCGAVRREKFVKLGGFDESYRKESWPRSGAIEDVQFGVRLHEAGGKLVLDPTIQVKHHKEWTVWSMIYADVFLRARPWTELMLRHGLPSNLNFRWQDRASVLLSAALPLLLWAGAMQRGVWFLPFAVAVLAIGVLQAPTLGFLARQRSAWFAAASLPLLIVHHLSAAAGFGLGVLRCEKMRDPWFLRAAMVFAILIFGVIQIAGGAYSAEFDGQQDESAHFMTGLMVRDFLVQLPLAHPIRWAEQYYVHYPRVRLGHWPPLFHAMEAIWFLLLPPSRFSAMLLMGLLAWAAALAFYRVARGMVGWGGAVGLTCLLMATPLFQQSTALLMTEMLSLVCGICFLSALARLLDAGGRGPAIAVALWAVMGLMVSGIAAALVPAPFVALLLARRWKLLPLRYLAIPAAVALAIGTVWFRMTMPSFHILALWAGIGSSTPWMVGFLWTLAGPGIAVLAFGGIVAVLMKAEPVPAAAAGTLLSIAAVGFVLRAMQEPRHWILIIPCVLLLAAECVRRAMLALPAWRVPVAAALALLALAFFPWERYTQTASGFTALADQVKLPARMFVSGSGWAEGSWIVIESLREQRPTSVIVRSTKELRGRQETPAGAQLLLDRLGIETVIFDDRPKLRRWYEGDVAMRKSVAGDGAWRACGRSGDLSAYCRVRPAEAPREPVTIDLHRYIGHTVSEK